MIKVADFAHRAFVGLIVGASAFGLFQIGSFSVHLTRRAYHRRVEEKKQLKTLEESKVCTSLSSYQRKSEPLCK